MTRQDWFSFAWVKVPNAKRMISTTSDEIFAVLWLLNRSNAHGMSWESIKVLLFSVVHLVLACVSIFITNEVHAFVCVVTFHCEAAVHNIRSLFREQVKINVVVWFCILSQGNFSFNDSWQSLMIEDSFLSLDREDWDFTLHRCNQDLLVVLQEVTAH